ncbi:MAG: serpin family protein, partial [Pseudomonadota bacterium]|nr:serpin family protein [Pseudomonadota bacterium]
MTSQLELAVSDRFWIDYSAKSIAAHKDNYVESIYQSVHTLAMLATGAGTGPATDVPYVIVRQDGTDTVIDPNTLQAIIGSTYATPDGMEHLHKLLDSWDQKLLQQNVAVDWQRSNALWVQAEYPVLNSFLDTQIRYYAPEIVGLDFRNDMYGSGQFIATSLNAASQDRLTPLLTFSGNQISEQTRLVTLNSEAVSAA